MQAWTDTVLGTPIDFGTLRHKAYARGWEHGATSHRGGREEMPPEGPLRRIYQKGREAGKASRAAAWAAAQEHKAAESASVALVKLEDHRTSEARMSKGDLEQLAKEGVAYVLRLLPEEVLR